MRVGLGEPADEDFGRIERPDERVDDDDRQAADEKVDVVVDEEVERRADAAVEKSEERDRGDHGRPSSRAAAASR